MARKTHTPGPNAAVSLGSQELAEMEAASKRRGFSSVNEYLLALHKKTIARETTPAPASVAETAHFYNILAPTLCHKTKMGKIYCGDSLGLLHKTLSPGSIDLIITSPPFGLVRKKSYGNEDAENYVDWFRPFAEGMRRVLKEKGSLVIDIGGAWRPGMPTRSLYHFELLLALCKDYGFHLCQEHYWWNPAKLPTPAEWVNVRRIRVKDAVNCIWWLSKTPWPKASNKRILTPYSESMKTLLVNGYKPKLRPSGHDISDKFQKNNGGSVPPNLLALANTESNSSYQEYCRANNLPVHPARFPSRIPEYFIRMLTDENDTVLDPFAGSCVTGEVAENLSRFWLCCELDEDYIKGAISRFPAGKSTPPKADSLPYKIYPPCALNGHADTTRLSSDGGFSRPAEMHKPQQSPASASFSF